MEIEILKQQKHPLLNRIRVNGFVHFDGATPSRLQIRDALAKKLSSDTETTVIRHVYQRFGENKAKVIVHVYDDAHAMTISESSNLLKKHGKQKQEKKESEEAEKETAEKKEE